MTRRDRATFRRCLALRVAVVFGILLAIFYRDHLPTVVIAFAGIALALATIWRNCRGTARERS